mmetsp:Transcript_20443/g.64269  ORF Transcript_20443/g.64269 Transcript_20443/m.64269 type:complete len:212 (+) Transcript_20443:1318-1953(+)
MLGTLHTTSATNGSLSWRTYFQTSGKSLAATEPPAGPAVTGGVLESITRGSCLSASSLASWRFLRKTRDCSLIRISPSADTRGSSSCDDPLGAGASSGPGASNPRTGRPRDWPSAARSGSGRWSRSVQSWKQRMSSSREASLGAGTSSCCSAWSSSRPMPSSRWNCMTTSNACSALSRPTGTPLRWSDPLRSSRFSCCIRSAWISRSPRPS